jgi:hypothetical protein
VKLNMKTTILVSTGFVAGYLFAVKSVKQMYEDAANQEIAELKEHYKERLEKQTKEHQRHLEDQNVVLAEASDALLKYQGGVPTEPDVKRQVHEVIAREVAIQEVVASQKADDPDVEYAGKPPQIIPEDSFVDSVLNYPDETLLYYMLNDVLTTVDGRVIVPEQRTEFFGSLIEENPPTEEVPSICIRSYQLQKDFEVVFHAEAYESGEHA